MSQVSANYDYYSSHFKLVETNIPSSLVREIMDKAKVLFLCEEHSTQKHKIHNCHLIEDFWEENSRLLIEHEPIQRIANQPTDMADQIRYVNDTIAGVAKSWDLDNTADFIWSYCSTKEFYRSATLIIGLFCAYQNEANASLESEFYKVSEETKTLLMALISTAKHQVAIFEKLQNKFGFDYPWPYVFGGKSHETFSQLIDDAIHSKVSIQDFKTKLLDQLTSIWIHSLETFNSKTFSLKDERFYPRNCSLVTLTLQAEKETDKKVIVIAGMAHLRRYPKHELSCDNEKSVDLITHTLTEKNIPYAILKPTKKPTLHEPKSTFKTIGIKKYPNLEMMRDLLLFRNLNRTVTFSIDQMIAWCKKVIYLRETSLNLGDDLFAGVLMMDQILERKTCLPLQIPSDLPIEKIRT